MQRTGAMHRWRWGVTWPPLVLVCGRGGSDGVDDAELCDQQKYAGITMLAIIAGGWLVWLLSVYKFGDNDDMEDIVGLFSIFAMSVHPPRTPGARFRLVSTPLTHSRCDRVQLFRLPRNWLLLAAEHL